MSIPGPKATSQLDHIARALDGLEWIAVTQDGVSFKASTKELVKLFSFYVDIREYMTGWGDKVTDFGLAATQWVNDVLTAGQKPILVCPRVDVNGGFFTLWDTEIFFPMEDPFLPLGLEIIGSNRTKFRMGPNMGGTTDAKIGFHINEGSGSKTSVAAGWEAGTVGTPTAHANTSPQALVTIRDIYVDTPSTGYPAIRPALIVDNNTRVRLNNVIVNRLQYGLLCVNYTDNVFVEDSFMTNPPQAVVAGNTYNGVFWRHVGSGDGSKISGMKGSSQSPVVDFGTVAGGVGPRGFIVEAEVGGSYKFRGSAGILFSSGHADGDAVSNLIAEAHIESINAGITVDTYHWHRGNKFGTNGGPFIQIEDIATDQPSHVVLRDSYGLYACEPRSGRDEGYPDIYIKTAIDGTRITCRGNVSPTPNVTKLRGRTGILIRAANATLDAWLQTPRILSFMSGDFEIECTSATTAKIRRVGNAVNLIEPIPNPGLALVPATQSYLGGSGGTAGLLIGSYTYCVVLDNGYGYTTKQQATSVVATDAVQALRLTVDGFNVPAVARIWRSTTNAVTAPDKYIAIPICGRTDLIDIGNEINGYAWKPIGSLPLATAVADATINNANFDGYAFGGLVRSERVIVKSADEDIPDGVYTGLTPDTHLKLWVPAGNHDVILDLLYSASNGTTAGGLKWSFGSPAGSTGRCWELGGSTSMTVSTGNGPGNWNNQATLGSTLNLGGAQPPGTAGTYQTTAELHAIIAVTTAGYLTFQRTKIGSDGNIATTRIYAGSRLRIRSLD